MVLLSSPLRGEGRIGGSISGLALIILFLFYWLRSVSKLKPYFLLLIFSLLLLLPGIASLPVIDRDEAHFTQATRQMIQNNNYFQIRFQDITRFQKPPGINWLQAASVKVFSHADAKTMWPYRLPSLLGALFSVLFTYFFARRFYDPKTAAMGAGLLACALLLVAEAHMAVIDSMLLFSVVLMQGALWVIYEKEDSHWGWALCFWLALSFGLVLKGVTPLVAVLSIITLCIIDKKVSFLKRLHPIKGFILFLGLTLTWLWGVNEAEHSNYL
ncbi:MAG: phospholipid carrier-dependent glycosyltransferase, partial [Legionella sp.]